MNAKINKFLTSCYPFIFGFFLPSQCLAQVNWCVLFLSAPVSCSGISSDKHNNPGKMSSLSFSSKIVPPISNLKSQLWLLSVYELRASPCLTTKHQGKDVEKLYTKAARMSKQYTIDEEEGLQGTKPKDRRQAGKSHHPWKGKGRTEWRKTQRRVGKLDRG